MNPELLDFLYYHRELALAAAKKCGISTGSAESAYGNFAKKYIDPQLNPDELNKELKKILRPLDHSLFISNSHDLLMKVVTEDKKYLPKYIKSISEFYVAELGLNPDVFFSHCLNSSELKESLLGESKTLTSFEKLLTFFYCLRVYAKNDSRFNLTEKKFLTSLASHLDIEVKESEFWTEFRNYEKNFPSKISSLLTTKEQRLAFVGLVALATTEDGNLDDSEKTVLREYISHLSLRFSDLLELKKSGGIKLESLISKLPERTHSYVLLILLETIFVDKKIHHQEIEVITSFLSKTDASKFNSVHILQLYKQTLIHISSLNKEHEVVIRGLADVFNIGLISEEQRALMFYMVETSLNFSHSIKPSNLELQKCLTILGFDQVVIPKLIAECEKSFAMVDSHAQVLAYIDCLDAINNQSDVLPKSLIPMLDTLLSKYPVNKKKILNFVVSLVMSDGMVWSEESQLIEGLSEDFLMYKLEQSELTFYLGLCTGDPENVKFRFAPDVFKNLRTRLR